MFSFLWINVVEILRSASYLYQGKKFFRVPQLNLIFYEALGFWVSEEASSTMPYIVWSHSRP
jgi:hypothetical protein